MPNPDDFEKLIVDLSEAYPEISLSIRKHQSLIEELQDIANPDIEITNTLHDLEASLKEQIETREVFKEQINALIDDEGHYYKISPDNRNRLEWLFKEAQRQISPIAEKGRGREIPTAETGGAQNTQPHPRPTPKQVDNCYRALIKFAKQTETPAQPLFKKNFIEAVLYIAGNVSEYGSESQKSEVEEALNKILNHAEKEPTPARIQSTTASIHQRLAAFQDNQLQVALEISRKEAEATTDPAQRTTEDNRERAFMDRTLRAKIDATSRGEARLDNVGNEPRDDDSVTGVAPACGDPSDPEGDAASITATGPGI